MLTRGRRYLIHEHHGLAECIILLKLWLQRRALPTPRHGGIPTTVWTCLAVHVFQIATPSTIVEAGRAGVTAAAEAGRNAAVVGVAGDRRAPPLLAALLHAALGPLRESARAAARRLLIGAEPLLFREPSVEPKAEPEAGDIFSTLR